MAKDDAKINITADGKEVTAALGKIQKDMDTMANSVTGRFSRLGGAMTALAPFVGAAWDAVKVGIDGVKDSIMDAADREQVKLRFGRLLLDPAAGDEFVAQLTELAAKTPLEMGEIFDAGAAIVARTPMRGEEALDFIRRAGDLAVSANIPLSQMIDTLTKPFQRGGISNEVVEMLENANVAFKKTLAEAEGITEQEVFANISKKKYGVEEFVAVIRQLTDEGSQAFGMMAAQAETFGGKLSTLEDSFGELKVKMGEQMLPVLTDLIGEAGIALDALTPVFEAIGAAIAQVVESDIAPLMGTAFDEASASSDAIADGLYATVDAASELIGVLGAVWDVMQPLVSLIWDFHKGFHETRQVAFALVQDWAAAVGIGEGGNVDRVNREHQEKWAAEATRETDRIMAGINRDNRMREAKEKRQKAKEEREARAQERAEARQVDNSRLRSVLSRNKKKEREEENASRRKSWSDAESERRLSRRMAGLRDMPYEKRRQAVEDSVRRQGVTGDVSDESITARINELMQVDPVGHEEEIAELKRMRELWGELVEARQDYQKSAEADSAELLARYYEAMGDKDWAFEIREDAAIDARTAELESQGASSEEAYARAKVESELRRLEREMQQTQAARVEFVQQDGAHLGNGATSIRLGDMQLSETKRGVKVLENIHSYLKMNVTSGGYGPVVLA